ncbi:MAG: hypothetical protein ACOZNI_19800 [Myxococcota bacterium]
MLAAYPTPSVQRLAEEVYDIVLARKNEPARRCITYRQVCNRIGPTSPFNGKVSPDDEILRLALRYVVERCHAAGLPALSALVVNARTRRPGPGYYPIAHGVDITDPNAERLWKRERTRAWRCTTYPVRLP